MTSSRSFDRRNNRKQAGSSQARWLPAWLLTNTALQSRVVLALVTSLFALLSLAGSQRKSATVDEPVHLFSGYTYVRWGDFRANPEHPPLAKILAAAPLTFLPIKDFRPSPSWDLIPTAPPTAFYTATAAAEMLFVQNDADRLFLYSKVMMITIAIALGCFIYMSSKSLFGTGGALAAVFFYFFDPNILAHAPIVHTDLPFAAFYFMSSYFFWRALHVLSLRNVTLTAFFFALAVVTKYAYIPILSAWALLGIYRICASQPIVSALGKRQPISGRLPKSGVVGCVVVAALLAAYTAVWMVYGFQYYAIAGGKSPLGFHQVWPQSALIQSLCAFLIRHHLVPEAWLYGQLSLLDSLNRDSYLLGQTSLARGSFLYFPIAFLVKTPIPVIMLLVAALTFREIRKTAVAIPWLAICGLTYFCFAIATGINIGVRHILAIYPFLFVLCGGTAAALYRSESKARSWGAVFLGAWTVVSSFAAYPNYLAYFNEFVAGPRNGHKILLDSNLDWGQDLKELRNWMNAAGVAAIQYFYFGFPSAAAPRYYGIHALFLPGSWVHPHDVFRDPYPRPPYLAISMNQLHGLYFEGGDKELVKSLRKIEPVARVGYSIWVYKMDAAIEELRRRVQAEPGSAIAHYDLANLLNHQGMTDEAIARYRDAVALEPLFVAAHTKLALALAKAGAWEPAMEHLRAVLRVEPRSNEGEIRYYLGTILLYQGRYAEAAESLRAAVNAEPNSTRAHQQLARAFSAQGNLDEAIRYYRSALRLDSSNAELHVALSRALAAQGERDEAISHYEAALSILRAAPKSSASPTMNQRERQP
jgi:tetratricopeptide (TPR) repeat protein